MSKLLAILLSILGAFAVMAMLSFIYNGSDCMAERYYKQKLEQPTHNHKSGAK